MLLNAPRMCCVGDNSGSGLAFRHSNMSSGSGVRTATSKTELVVVVGDLGGLDLTKGTVQIWLKATVQAWFTNKTYFIILFYLGSEENIQYTTTLLTVSKSRGQTGGLQSLGGGAAGRGTKAGGCPRRPWACQPQKGLPGSTGSLPTCLSDIR